MSVYSCVCVSFSGCLPLRVCVHVSVWVFGFAYLFESMCLCFVASVCLCVPVWCLRCLFACVCMSILFASVFVFLCASVCCVSVVVRVFVFVCVFLCAFVCMCHCVCAMYVRVCVFASACVCVCACVYCVCLIGYFPSPYVSVHVCV